ncbi:MAG: alanine--tRNA ligase-related protein, partial [Candidatus Saccharimonadales bacterium]
MTAEEIRKRYLEYFAGKGHKIIPRALLVPQDDPTTLFTGSGMQPLIPYLLGEPHPDGKRVADSQTCFRAEDMDEVGDNRHTTFFEMLGNWSFGDYFKEDQLTWFWDFLTKVLSLDPQRLYVTCFFGDQKVGVPKDTESAKIWKDLLELSGDEVKEVDLPGDEGSQKGMQDGRIFYYDAQYNWWSREGEPSHMRDGEPGGPDSEVFYEFTQVEHDKKFGEQCHPNCDCGRFLEIGNSVFMTYRKVGNKFEELPKPNVDFGGGLERIAAAVADNPDIFQISLIKPIIEQLEELSGKEYERYQNSMRVIADHLRAGVFLAVDGVVPSNKQQGYVLRRLLRRAIRYAFDLGIEQDLCEKIAPTIINLYKNDFPEVAEREKEVIDVFTKEEKIFRQTLRKGLQVFEKIMQNPVSVGLVGNRQLFNTSERANVEYKKVASGEDLFVLYDTYGFPLELILEEAFTRGISVPEESRTKFHDLLEEQRSKSRTASVGMFKGGLADHSEEVIKL